MSAWICGCDPEADYRCERFPHCTYGFAHMVETEVKETFVDPREERIEKAYINPDLDKQLTSLPGSEVRITDEKTGGQKGTKLARFSLLPWDVLWEIAEHFGKGASKYADRNWERGYKWSLSYDAMLRHFAAFWHGEDWGNDKVFGRYRHVIAGVWHGLVLCAFALRHVGTDDRPAAAEITNAKE